MVSITCNHISGYNVDMVYAKKYIKPEKRCAGTT